MSEPRLEAVAAGRFRLGGELSFVTVPGLVRRGGELFENGAELSIDLADVTRADSAGVALLIEWRREAQRRGCGIRFENIPAQMQAIARLSYVDRLLAVQ
jgi:phospholipid transport system transporter-binding protein